MKVTIQRKPIDYTHYESKSAEYIQGELIHTERSARKFELEGDQEEAEDRRSHARKLWEMYADKSAATLEQVRNRYTAAKLADKNTQYWKDRIIPMLERYISRSEGQEKRQAIEELFKISAE